MTSPLIAYLHQGRIALALSAAASARAVFDALGDDDGVAALDSRRAEIMAVSGRTHEALELLSSVRDRERAAGRTPQVAWCDLRIGRALLRAGRPEDAVVQFEAARAVFMAVGAPQYAAVARVDSAEALLAQEGRAGDAVAVLRGTLPELRRAGLAWEARRCRRAQAAARTSAMEAAPRAVASAA